MRIEHLELKNMRLFGNTVATADFAQDKHVTILLGNNGCGKTTVLDAIASLLDPYLSVFPGKPKGRAILDTDIHINEGGRLSSFLSLHATLCKGNNSPTISVTRNRKGLDSAPPSDLTEIKAYANELKENVLTNANIIVPILAYYGTGRGQIKAPERKRNFQREYERWDCYTNAMTPNTEFKRFQAWFDTMEIEELKQGKQQNDLNYKLPTLQCVRNAIEQFVGEKYKRPRNEEHPLRFILDELDVQGNTLREIRLTQFSDGYKIVTAMVADIASRMCEANPHLPDPLLSPGIVLIDEIDLHLHPRWQRTILNSLHTVFPNVQFIVTTHSPVIVIGAIGIAQVLLLDGTNIRDINLSQYDDYDVGLLLLSELFDMDTIQRQKMADLKREQESLLLQYDLTPQQRNRLQELDRQLSNTPVAAMSVYADMLKVLLTQRT